MEKTWEEVLPLYGIEEDCILSKQGDYTIGYRMIRPEIFTLSGTDYETLLESYTRGMRVLFPGCIIHTQDWYLKDAFHQDPQPGRTWLAEASDRFFEGRPYLNHEAFLFITRRGRRWEGSSGRSGLIFSGGVPKDALDKQAVIEFQEVCDQFAHILESSKLVMLERLKESELRSGPDKAGLIERYCTLATGKVPILKDVRMERGLQIGDEYCQLFTLGDAEDMPGVCSPWVNHDVYSTDKTTFPIGFASKLGPLLNCNHICSTYIFIDSPQEVLSKMEARRRRLQSLATYSRENAASQEAIHEFLTEAVTDQQLPVRIHSNVLTWTDDPYVIPTLKNQASAALAQMGASPRLETVGAPQIWFAGIPGNAADFPMNETSHVFANQAACFLQMETNYRDSAGPFGLRLGDRISGRPLLVDIDKEPKAAGITGNGNMFVLSGSGGGKSFLINHLLREYHDRGVHAVMVDVGHSYRAQCELHGGYYFTYEESAPIHFNPFYPILTEGMDTEKKESLKTLLLALWKKADETANRAEYVALSSALQAYFDRIRSGADVFPCFDSFYEFMKTGFREELENAGAKEKEFDLDNFLYVLGPYYRGGEFDYLLNAKENLDLLGQRFIVFELDNIKDHPILFPVVTLIIMELFVSKMRKLEGVMKVICIEEAWKAIASSGMAAYMKYLVKTVRKFNAKVVVVTQEVEDIVSSPIVRNAIVNNSDIKILLDQSKFQNKFTEIQELLGITDKQKTEILSINKGHSPGSRYKDLWIGLGATHSKVYRLEVSPEEYFLYTSDQQEKVMVREYSRRWGGIQEGIRRLVADLKGGTLKSGQILVTVLLVLLPGWAPAQDPVSIISEGITKVIKAVDLHIQRIQTETIWLEEAQKVVENAMSQLDLDDIQEWVEEQKDLYGEYFQELKEVKTVIAYYHSISEMIALQEKILASYRSAYGLLSGDTHFTAAELAHISAVYAGMIGESGTLLQDLQLAVQSLSTQMTDEQRLAIINRARTGMEKVYTDMQRFSNQNILLSVQRGGDAGEINLLKKLYGL